MLKLAVKNPKFYFFAKSIRFFGRFFELRFTSLADMDTEDFCRYSLSRQVPGGQFVTTAEKRFSDLDAIAVGLIEQQKNPAIHDVAVSSGITSLELFEALKSRGITFEMSISDKNFDCFYTGNLIRRVYDPQGNMFECQAFGIFCDAALSNKFFISKNLGKLLNRPAGNEKKVKIRYLDRRVRALVEAGKINCISYDILTGGADGDIVDKFTFVRCMNILNTRFFVEQQILEAAKRIVRSMREGGVFQVGRTDEKNINRASFFRKEGDKLVLKQDINGGAEIKEALGGLIVESEER